MLRTQIAGVIALVLPLWAMHAPAQANPNSPATPQRIEAELKAIETAAAHHATDDQLGELWGLLAVDYQDEMDFPRAQQAYDRSLKLLRGSVTARRSYAAILDSLASLYALTDQLPEAENCRRKALAIYESEGDLMDSLALHGNLSATLLKEGKLKDAESEASQEIEGISGHPEPYAAALVLALNTRSYARCLQHRCDEGLSDARHALEIAQSFLSPNSLAAASSWSVLGYMEWKSGGDVAGCDEKMRKALQLLSDQNSEVPHPALVDTRIWVLKEYQQVLAATHRKAEARQIEAEMARLKQDHAPICTNCTVNVDGLTKSLPASSAPSSALNRSLR